MADISSFTSMLMSWVINPLLWLIIIAVLFGGTFGALVLRKKKRLKYRALEYVDLGNGRYAVNILKCGWFGKKISLKGLWWRGEDVLRTDTGEQILDFSTEDYTEINGKRGVVVYRDPLNQEILVPITRSTFKNKELIAEIAPSSYRDAAIDIFNESVKETTEFREKLIQFASWAMIIIFALVSIIVIVQMVKNGQDKAAELLLQAGDKGAAQCRDICREAVNIAVTKITG